MSKPKNDDQSFAEQADPTPAGDEFPADNPAPAADNPASGGNGSPDQKTGPELFTIEEHARRLNIDAPVFAAVMQTERWANGKKVPEAVFKQAVEGFLNAPMGGKK